MSENIVRLDKRGHLCIPITKEKYEIVSNLSLDIGLKDFNRLKRGKWDRFFNKLHGKRQINSLDWYIFNCYLADIVFFKVKKEYKKDLKNWDLLKICMVLYISSLRTFDIEIDCLRRVRK